MIPNRNIAADSQRSFGISDDARSHEIKHRRNEELAEQVDRLSLIANAMWELLQQAFPALTIDHLTAKMHEIDGRDGVHDGSTHRPPRDCASPTCDAKVMAGSPRCQFCGADAPAPPDPFSF